MTTDYPIDWIRSQFPALRGDVVHMDNAAGSQVPQQTIDMVTRALTEWNANQGASHRVSREITSRRDLAKVRTASFLGVRPEEVFFGSNATTLITLAADAWRRRLEPGDEVVVTDLDHQANVDPWVRLERSGVVVRRWPVRGGQARLVIDDLAALVGPRTKLLAITGASNALGAKPAVRQAADVVHQAGGHVFVDAVHLAAHEPPDPSALGADMLVFSPYKVFGPHLGVLWLSEELRDELPHHGLAFMEQGSPGTWETGTQNHEGIAGWLGTFDYFDECAKQMGTRDDSGARSAEEAGPVDIWSRFAEHERDIAGRMLAGLRALRAELYGPPGPGARTPTVSFNIKRGPDAQTIAERVAAHRVAVSAGHYYAYGLMMRSLGLEGRGGAVRASAVHYTSVEDVDRLVDAVSKAII